MAKFALIWHKEGNANLLKSIERYEKERDALHDKIRALIRKYSETRIQIEKAESQGLTEFDPERFGIPRKKKVA